jgi:hypothetical protein
MNWA